jgi:hypothetical protein
MANTNGTNSYSGSPGEPRRSGRNRKHAHETGGAREPRKKAVPKGQHKDPPELLTYLNAQAQLPCKDQESLGSNTAAALKHHQLTVGDPSERSGSAPAQGSGIAQQKSPSSRHANIDPTCAS